MHMRLKATYMDFVNAVWDFLGKYEVQDRAVNLADHTSYSRHSKSRGRSAIFLKHLLSCALRFQRIQIFLGAYLHRLRTNQEYL